MYSLLVSVDMILIIKSLYEIASTIYYLSALMILHTLEFLFINDLFKKDNFIIIAKDSSKFLTLILITILIIFSRKKNIFAKIYYSIKLYLTSFNTLKKIARMRLNAFDAKMRAIMWSSAIKYGLI